MEVRYTKTAQRALRRIPAKKADSIINKMDEVATNPYQKDNMIKSLEGVDNGYRRRFGDYRVLYTVNDTIEILEVFKIGKRGDVYK